MPTFNRCGTQPRRVCGWRQLRTEGKPVCSRPCLVPRPEPLGTRRRAGDRRPWACLSGAADRWLGGARPRRWAGGGPENVLLVVNSASWASQAVANQYIRLRHIPAGNVCYLDWNGGFEHDRYRQLSPADSRPGAGEFSSSAAWTSRSTTSSIRATFPRPSPPKTSSKARIPNELYPTGLAQFADFFGKTSLPGAPPRSG